MDPQNPTVSLEADPSSAIASPQMMIYDELNRDLNDCISRSYHILNTTLSLRMEAAIMEVELASMHHTLERALKVPENVPPEDKEESDKKNN